MKRFILIAIILLFTIFSYAQTDTIKVVKGQKYYKPNSGYGVDTCQAWIIQNKNADGNAGLIAISGTDTMFFFIDGNGYGNIQNDENIYITSNDTILFVAKVKIDSTLQMNTGTSINEFSIDGTLIGNSDDALVTEKAIKTYVASTMGTIDSSWVTVTTDSLYIVDATKDDTLTMYHDGTNSIFNTDGNLFDFNKRINVPYNEGISFIDGGFGGQLKSDAIGGVGRVWTLQAKSGRIALTSDTTNISDSLGLAWIELALKLGGPDTLNLSDSLRLAWVDLALKLVGGDTLNISDSLRLAWISLATKLTGTDTLNLSDSLRLAWLKLYWDKTGNFIYPTNITDSLGLGTNTPTEILDVNGNVHITGLAHAGSTNIFDIDDDLSADIFTITDDAFFNFDGKMKIDKANHSIMFGELAGEDLSATGSYNVFLGHNSGLNVTDGDHNFISGNEAGYDLTTGVGNIFIGKNAGDESVSSTAAIFIGYESGSNTSTSITGAVGIGYRTLKGVTIDAGHNIAIGFSAGENVTSGTHNNFIGYQAGMGVSTQSDNIAIGFNSQDGASGTGTISLGTNSAGNNTGDYCIAIGIQSLQNNTGNYNIGIGTFAGDDPSMSGANNLFIGYESGTKNTTGANNISMGCQAGHENLTGNGNVFLGYQAGYSETGSNKLYIENSNSATPLIYGEFDNDFVKINGEFETTDTARVPYIVIDTILIYDIPKAYMYFADSTFVLPMTVNNEIQITNPTDSLYGKVEFTDGFSYIGDTVITPIWSGIDYDLEGFVKFTCNFTTRDKEYIFRIYVDGVAQETHYVVPAKDGKNASFNINFYWSHNEFTQGDEIYFTIENTENDDDVTFINSKFLIECSFHY